ncbi:hypothetical protein MXAN_0383 [Myxococcus xanthus DK 1622]|uniref:Uncharacterized protein n=1 Tax=Myxococcus xanthus (strain DK1622) TaxID=246197 RepID=Q1DFB8_MYXXD|nr:hypothetical protein MXAN_0383 [Myxococcus xanthus DK 1622]
MSTAVACESTGWMLGSGAALVKSDSSGLGIGNTDRDEGGSGCSRRTRRAIWRWVTDAIKEHRHLRGPYVFCLDDGKPLTAHRMDRPLQHSLRRAGITREVGIIGWLDLRHTDASHLAMRGVPRRSAEGHSGSMGHTPPST